jgi:hypothetical protein
MNENSEIRISEDAFRHNTHSERLPFEFAHFGFPRPFGEAKFRPALTGGVYSIVEPNAFNIQLH